MSNNILIRPAHGGGRNQAIKKYSPTESMVDLSTGINPVGWPVPLVPAEVYNRLPEADDGLIEIAQCYYKTQNILPVSGSQEAIQLLPVIFHQYGILPENPKIGIISPCYAEHEFQWKKNNFSIIHLVSQKVDDVIESLNVLLLINPNNPTGELIAIETLNKWLSQLKKNKGYLIIDEAFMDAAPEHSMIRNNLPDNLIVLRSVGKFFGLAGVRCGFVIAQAEILSYIEYHQGPWSVSGPTRWLIKKALMDHQWIENNKLNLKKASIRLDNLLSHYFFKIDPQSFITGSFLFKTVYLNNACDLFEQLAKQGVLVRLLDKACTCSSCSSLYKNISQPNKGLRFGLPANEAQWQKLEEILELHVKVSEDLNFIANMIDITE